MNNAVSQPQTVVVLGGSSEIGRAIVDALVSPALRDVVLAVRRPDECVPPTFGDATVRCVEFDADRPETHAAVIEGIADTVGDLDVVIQAFGRLGPTATPDPVDGAGLAVTNFVGAVSSGLAVADRLRQQGHGTLVVLSSVAGVRTRPSNFVYGATKAGQDAFATGLGHALHGTGAHVLTVRPGFVRTAMTDGMAEAPFAADPAEVADAVVAGLRRGRDVVWAPGVLRAVFAVLRVVPGFVWRRLDR